jgi:hypothetical protein
MDDSKNLVNLMDTFNTVAATIDNATDSLGFEKRGSLIPKVTDMKDKQQAPVLTPVTTPSQPSAPAMSSVRLGPAPAMSSVRLGPAPAMSSVRVGPAPAMSSVRLGPAPAMSSVRLGPAPAPASTGVCGATAIRAFTILWENVLNNWKTKYASEIATGSTSTRKASYIEFALSELNRDGIHGDKYITDVKTKAQVYEDYGLFDNSSIVVDLSKIIPKWFSSQVAGSVRPEERAKLLHEHLTNIFRMTDTLTPGNIGIVSSIINLFISFRLFDDVAIRSFANKAVPSFGRDGANSSGASSLSDRLVRSERSIF